MVLKHQSIDNLEQFLKSKIANKTYKFLWVEGVISRWSVQRAHGPGH